MSGETVVILGIPIDNLSMDEALAAVFSMVDAYESDHRPRLVATVNVDFVVNTLSWNLGRVRHPELLDILRRADLITADGMPVVLTGKLLGTPLKERVTGADMVPGLAREAARLGKSIYFLGGRGDSAAQAAMKLQKDYPGFRIAGIDSPRVHVEGSELADSEEIDVPIVNRINEARPDILLIAFGNPKQEVWFNRNRHRLQAAVSIGVGGTFEFITGTVRRAPTWMQRAGLEWVFRISQDPGRLWKRYFVGFFKFGFMIWPAVLYDRYRRAHLRLRRSMLGRGKKKDVDPSPGREPGVGTSPGFRSVVVLPERLDLQTLERTLEEVARVFPLAKSIILDFRNVSFIDSSGLGFLVRTWRQAEREARDLHFLEVSPKIRRFFQLNRIWDLFRERSLERLEDEAGGETTSRDRQQEMDSFACTVSLAGSAYALLDLDGRLDAQQMDRIDMHALTSAIQDRNCLLNLDRLRFVDSSGLAFFLKIQRCAARSGKSCILFSVNENVLQLLKITKLVQLFPIAPDLGSARKMLSDLS